MKINYIECSPRGERSHSTKIAQAYLEQAKKNIEDLKIKNIHLHGRGALMFNLLNILIIKIL